MFPKAAQIVANTIFTWKGLFFKTAQKSQFIWATFETNIFSQNFKKLLNLITLQLFFLWGFPHTPLLRLGKGIWLSCFFKLASLASFSFISFMLLTFSWHKRLESELRSVRIASKQTDYSREMGFFVSMGCNKVLMYLLLTSLYGHVGSIL